MVTLQALHDLLDEFEEKVAKLERLNRAFYRSTEYNDYMTFKNEQMNALDGDQDAYEKATALADEKFRDWLPTRRAREMELHVLFHEIDNSIFKDVLHDDYEASNSHDFFTVVRNFLEEATRRYGNNGE